jgi:hypothetical protein
MSPHRARARVLEASAKSETYHRILENRALALMHELSLAALPQSLNTATRAVGWLFLSFVTFMKFGGFDILLRQALIMSQRAQ